MQWITYQVLQNVVDNENVFVTKKVGYSEANLAIAEAEAYNGEYTVEEDEEIIEKNVVYNDSVSIGGDSTAPKDNPKFESHYPIHAYAGIEGVTNYSTEEFKTGNKWIDGKPIYARVLTGSITTVKKDNTIGTISPIETVIRVYGFFDCGSGNLMPLNHYYNENWYAIGYIWKSTTSGVLLCNCNALATVRAVVEYTKPD